MGAWICLLLSISVPAEMSPPPQAVTERSGDSREARPTGPHPAPRQKQTHRPFKQLSRPCPSRLSAHRPWSHGEPGATPLPPQGSPQSTLAPQDPGGSSRRWGSSRHCPGCRRALATPSGGQPHPLLAPVSSFLEGSGADGLNHILSQKGWEVGRGNQWKRGVRLKSSSNFLACELLAVEPL